MTTLLPCPFCGTSDQLEHDHGPHDREGWPLFVLCANCGATGPWSYSGNIAHTETAADDWNQRAAPAAAH